MKQKKKLYYRALLWLLILFSLGTIGVIMAVDIYRSVPDTIFLKAGEESEISLHVPLSGKILMTPRNGSKETGGALSQRTLAADDPGTDREAGDGAGETLSGQVKEVISVPIDLNYDVKLIANTGNDYRAELKLFGIIPFKTVEIRVIDEAQVYPAGIPIGIYVRTPGVLVIGTGDFVGENGRTVMPSENILRAGDYILTVNGSEVAGKRDFVQRVADSGGAVMVMTIERGGRRFDVAARPEKNKDHEYKLGIWIKDSAQGIGTLTYVDADGRFGALGHGVSDSDTGIVLKLSDGALYRTDIIGITKGRRGIPGELTGIIRYTESNRLGSVTDNTAWGIFGEVNERLMTQIVSDPVEIGLKQDIRLGHAQIYCNVDGTPDYYDVEITDLDFDSSNVNKGITLKVTDERLIALTGGIVQGMSGSPIIQNGKLIGAVTHVLVNDARKGYGIFIEMMIGDHG